MIVEINELSSQLNSIKKECMNQKGSTIPEINDK